MSEINTDKSEVIIVVDDEKYNQMAIEMGVDLVNQEIGRKIKVLKYSSLEEVRENIRKDIGEQLLLMGIIDVFFFSDKDHNFDNIKNNAEYVVEIVTGELGKSSIVYSTNIKAIIEYKNKYEEDQRVTAFLKPEPQKIPKDIKRLILSIL